MKKITVRCAAALLACLILLGPIPVSAEQQNVAPVYGEQEIDLDLSQFSGTVVYAQIYQLAIHPEDYLGKIIRLSGWYDVVVDDETGVVYTVCFIPDATACCAQGIEFVWGGEHSFPDNYPESGTEIMVTGRFETYFEGEWEYMHLVDAELIWAQD
ncbi:MAG: hypothetical protein IKO52_14040 [Clostridia bacterium]|nr:hypothetical protein [Clostridia bacterium]